MPKKPKKPKKKSKKKLKDEEEKHPGGRPLKFESVDELQKKCDEYFNSCYEIFTVRVKTGRKKMKNGKYRNRYKREKKQKLIRPLTITGLALSLDTNRQTLINYEEKEEFFDTIKKAKLICENFAEEYLYTGKNVAGAIFNLKNNYAWKEEQTHKLKGGISLTKLFYQAKDE